MQNAAMSTATGQVPPHLFRSVMGSFPTGVTVITTTSEKGTPIGMTVNAITSVSLDPPQLLICLAKSRFTAAAIQENGRFGVNFLSDDQKQVAAVFASSAPEKFTGIKIRTGDLGVPLIEGSLARAECRVAKTVESGDHLIFIGDVLGAEAADGMPLIFFRRDYGKWEAV